MDTASSDPTVWKCRDWVNVFGCDYVMDDSSGMTVDDLCCATCREHSEVEICVDHPFTDYDSSHHNCPTILNALACTDKFNDNSPELVGDYCCATCHPEKASNEPIYFLLIRF